MNAIADHLWQSTLFAGVVWLLTLALRKNYARVRHGLWLAASCKFLVPFSLLIALGGQVQLRKASATVASGITVVMDQVSQPFTATQVVATIPATPSRLPAILLSIWACGFIGITCAWWVRWRRIRVAVRAGSPLHLDIPIQAVCSPTLLEPGVFGVFRPILLLPEGIFDRLTPANCKPSSRMNSVTSATATISSLRFTCSWKPSSGSILWSGGSGSGWSRSESEPAMKKCCEISENRRLTPKGF
jgi:beta-lactamase regulating signal transducer with metallopeptidase domain